MIFISCAFPSEVSKHLYWQICCLEGLILVNFFQNLNPSDICLIDMCFDSGDVSVPIYFLISWRIAIAMGISSCCLNLWNPLEFGCRIVWSCCCLTVMHLGLLCIEFRKLDVNAYCCVWWYISLFWQVALLFPNILEAFFGECCSDLWSDLLGCQCMLSLIYQTV